MKPLGYIWTTILAVSLGYSGLVFAEKPDSSNCPCYQDFQLIVEGIIATTCVTEIDHEHSVSPDRIFNVWWLLTEGSSAFCGALAVNDWSTVKSCGALYGHMAFPELCAQDFSSGFDDLTDDQYKSCLYAAKEAKRQLEKKAMCE